MQSWIHGADELQVTDLKKDRFNNASSSLVVFSFIVLALVYFVKMDCSWYNLCSMNYVKLLCGYTILMLVVLNNLQFGSMFVYKFSLAHLSLSPSTLPISSWP